MAKRNMSAALIASNWNAGMQNAVNSGAITRGVQAVTQAPGQRAAAQASLWQQQVSSQQTMAKWQRRVAAVTLNDWQLSMQNKGIPRISSGATEAASSQGKETAFAQALYTYIQGGLGNLPARGNYNQNLTRLTAWITYMHNFNYTPPTGVIPAYTVPGA